MKKFDRSKITFVALLWVVIGMPVTVMFLAMEYYNSIRLELVKSQFFAQSEQLAGEVPAFNDNETFWTNLLNQTLSRNGSTKKLFHELKEMFEKLNQKVEFAVWHKASQKIELSEGLKKIKKYDWSEIGSLVHRQLDLESDEMSIFDEFKLRKIFGPHFQLKKIKESLAINRSGFVYTDFLGLNPFFWARRISQTSAFVLLPPSISGKKTGIREFFRVNGEKNKICLMENNRIYRNFGKFSDLELQKFKKIFDNSAEKVIYIQNCLIYGETLPKNCFFIKILEHNQIESGKISALIAVSLVFLLVIVLRSFSITWLSNRLKVKTTVFALIGFSNIFPLIILAFFTNQYLEQKLQVLIDKKRTEAIALIRQIEENFISHIRKYPAVAGNIMSAAIPELREKGLNLDLAKKLHSGLVKNKIDFNIIASQTVPVLARKGLFQHKKGLYPLLPKNQLEEVPTKIVELAGKVGGAYLSFWNEIPISQQALTEAELVADMVFQKPIDESLHMIVEICDNIGYFGFGSVVTPSFAEVLSLHEPGKGDYICIYQFSNTGHGRKFNNSIQSSRLGNAYGIKVIGTVRNEFDKDRFAPFGISNELMSIFNRLKDFPPVKAEITNLLGEDWIYVGYRSHEIENHDFVAFYPLKEIINKLEVEKKDLGRLLLASLFIVLIIAFFFSQTLLNPLRYLEDGTHAIDARNFSYRLPDMGEDEFGRMAQVLNSAIADLEDLSVARVVQQSLFPSSRIDAGNFDLFGKSVTLADLGGDYFDYFEVDQNRIGVILGDVAGHGVGAAMIMAIAKSATLNSKKYLSSPVDLTLRLHDLIYRTKTKKQKKIMTFQYLLVDRHDSTVKFCNAGGCNPYIVNGPAGKVEEIILPAAALGAFKKGKFAEKQIDFMPGDVMVLYTDGIVEARNSSGEEIGYPRFKEILLRNWNADSEKFYQAVVDEYLAWLGNEPPQDDLTMIFLSRPV
ncbi:MAG: PP2C family protein-serine/threonine phosphatase [Candidatus Rifleibacteriota bacterium]